MPITRRVFLRNSALAVVGTAAVPSFLARVAMGAADTGLRTKRLVVIFQRGAADGLNIVIPHAEPQYYAMRPSINIPRKDVLDLDGFFGLHPSLASFQPIWQQRQLAIVHAAGSPDPSRSHFEAQDFMEAGTPGIKATEDGWLNRSLHNLPRPSPECPWPRRGTSACPPSGSTSTAAPSPWATRSACPARASRSRRSPNCDDVVAAWPRSRSAVVAVRATPRYFAVSRPG